MKRVFITIAAVAATGLAIGAVYAQQGEAQGGHRHAHGAEHKDGRHAERHKRMAERHARMAERHGKHRHADADKPAASGEQPKPEEHKH